MDGQGGYFYPRGYFNNYNPYLQYNDAQLHFNIDPNQSPSHSAIASTVQPPSNSPSTSASTNQPSCSSNNSSSPDEEVEKQAPSKGKKTYDKFPNDQQKALVNLWAEKHDDLDSKDNRKVWDDIARQLNAKFKLTRGTDKYKQKMKYLIDRYKIAKDWNRKQTGGNRRESPFYNEIDQVLGCREIVKLQHVADVGTSSAKLNESSDACDGDEAESAEVEKGERSERKKSRKRARSDKDDAEERELMANAFHDMKEHRENMSKFMENYTRAQEQQTQTMNALVGALTTFLQNSKRD